jgi:hypothetical protein
MAKILIALTAFLIVREASSTPHSDRCWEYVRIPVMPVTYSCSSRSVILVDAGRVGGCLERNASIPLRQSDSN